MVEWGENFGSAGGQETKVKDWICVSVFQLFLCYHDGSAEGVLLLTIRVDDDAWVGGDARMA